MRRILLSPGWLLRHALLIVCVVLFAKLGWWQWEKGRSSHGTLQNLFYGLEWPVFAGFAVFMWWKMLRDELKPPATGTAEHSPDDPDAVEGGDVVARVRAASRQAPPPDEEEDEELAAYNRYLASLYARDERRAR